MPNQRNASEIGRDLIRATERTSIDSLDVDRALKGVQELKRYVGGWGVYDRVLIKIARAILERKISPTRVGEIIETIIVRRRLPKGHEYYIPEPGRYFVVSVKDEFARNGHPWNWRDRKQEDEI